MNRTIVVSVMAATLMLGGHAFAQQYTFATIDVQCPPDADASACPAALAPGQVAAQTGAKGINNRGEIVGFYVAGGKQHGFVLSNGVYTSLDFPVAGVRATIANGINSRGEIVGQYTLPVHDLNNPPPEDSPLYCPSAADPACIKGFYYWRGQFSTLMFPATTDEAGQSHIHPGAIAQRITEDGDIYGCLHDHDLTGSMFGAVWTRHGTSSMTANGGELTDGMAMSMSMNNGATPSGHAIVGLAMVMDMVTNTSQQHGFVVRSGMLGLYDPTSTTNLTAIWDMNTSQQFVGTYRERNEVAAKRHGFLQNADDSAAITVDFTCQDPTGCSGSPFGTVAFSTVASGINSDGVIVGQHSMVNGGAPHGFIAIADDVN